jgi:HPt (histidine-containing phosphotransfer) domain-containing protein
VRPLSAAAEAAPVTTDVTSEPGATVARRPVNEIVDWSVIEELRAFSTDEMDLVRELVASFEVNVTQQLPELEQAVRRDDAETTRFIAHRLRGSCGNIGARRMEFLCERLEQLGRAGVTIGAMELVDDLWAEFARVRAALGTDDAGN